MTDCKNLDLAREWAEWVKDNPDVYGGTSDRSRAAADLISSLQEEWVDAEDLRNWINLKRGKGLWSDSEAFKARRDLLNDLEALLPVPPAPEPASPRSEDVPEFDTAYTYRDRDGDEWEYIDGRWITGDTHDERVTEREFMPGHAILPVKYGPYTRIEA